MEIKNSMKILLAVTFLFSFLIGCGAGKPMDNQSDKGQNTKKSQIESGNKADRTDSMNAIKDNAVSPKQGSEALKGRIICIDAGHQEKGNNEKEPVAPGSSITKDKTTSGTAGVVTRVPEYKLNLDVSLLLKDKLEQKGAKIIMTRETHDVDLSNIERAKIANESNTDLTIRIHADGAADSKVRGASVLYPGNKYIKDDALLERSRSAAKYICEEIEGISEVVSSKTVERNDLTGFNWSKVPVVLVEMGFMSNPDEDRMMNTQAFHESMAEAIAQGVVEYFE